MFVSYLRECMNERCRFNAGRSERLIMSSGWCERRTSQNLDSGIASIQERLGHVPSRAALRYLLSRAVPRMSCLSKAPLEPNSSTGSSYPFGLARSRSRVAACCEAYANLSPPFQYSQGGLDPVISGAVTNLSHKDALPCFLRQSSFPRSQPLFPRY